MSATLNLDKFELMWLLEGAAGKSHLRWDIYRMFIEDIYPQLNYDEREFLYTYIKRDTAWLWEHKTLSDKTPHEYWMQVLARFNPANQYTVTATHDGLTETKDAYLFNGRYYITMNSFFADEYITNVERKPFKKCGNDICASRMNCLRYSELKSSDKFVDISRWSCDKCDMIIEK